MARWLSLLMLPCLALSAPAFAPVPVFKPRPLEGDLKKMQGKWRCVEKEGWSLVSSNDRLSVFRGETIAHEWKVSLDETMNPKVFEFKRVDQKDLIRGIYRLEGDSLIFCFHTDNRLPRSFEDPYVKLDVLERKRP